MPADLLERYIDLLGVQRRKPGLEAFYELVQAHIMQVPFENLSKLYYKKHLNLRGIPDLELYLDGIRRFHFGGTCYSNNYYLYLLLAESRLPGQIVRGGYVESGRPPGQHGYYREPRYLVDGGYAAPFLIPLPAI